ncbi:MAG: alpha-L-fucosidase, partial [Candidatus Aminicenantaceae bacterium]
MLKKKWLFMFFCLFIVLCLIMGSLSSCRKEETSETKREAIGKKFIKETEEQRNERMAWWREASFGLFIHWGLYAIPAGEWKGETDHAEWILTTAQIPVDEYEKFAPQFNPVKFDAAEWVRIAKNAGMKYIIITSK